MQLRIIRNINKYLNFLSIITLSIGTFSILLIAKITTYVWATITIILLLVGLVSILINWLIIKYVTIKIEESEIIKVFLNIESEFEDLTKNNDTKYLGNFILLHNKKKYEFYRSELPKLKRIIPNDKFEIRTIAQKWYNISPGELIKNLLRFAP